MKQKSNIAFFLVLLLFVAIDIGCGNRAKGGGVVKYGDGDTVPSGVIFFANEHYNYRGTIQDGRFSLGGMREDDGLPPGIYKVYVLGSVPSPNSDKETPLFAPKYTSADQSGIVVEIKKGEPNRFEIVVEKP